MLVHSGYSHAPVPGRYAMTVRVCGDAEGVQVMTTSAPERVAFTLVGAAGVVYWYSE